ncbi:DNA/RNA nuclease SfsA [Seongchinamella sediminis]|uniref:Sugar fermentation stimulation protein homolog n=1 Tax=Seongchinamella sediminis TaxID=2283635 RepID=A0A3L7DXC2_9GAMM|nr:DNA/RNA nuclease SfsA [Seongchinamella sediminis]RLQ20472.1 DNA/RNA nuclease SfsA [Seongchinamella sediminis]
MSELIEGRLLRRYKRFLADVELADGQQITAHCPNTGAMTGCAQPDSRVWLSRSDAKTRKYPHTWELVATATGMACIHSARANKVVRQAFEAGLIPGFEGYPQIRSEVKYGNNSRADLLLEGPQGQVYVEVKSVTLCLDNGQGLFPDAVSDRGRKHLLELESVVDDTTRAVMFFCALHSGVARISAAGEIDPRYRDTLAAVMGQGVEVMAWGARVAPEELVLERALPFSLDPHD